MCYLIAKDKNKRGCIALKTKHGKQLSEMKRMLNERVMDKGVQLVTISRPSAFGEYAPYSHIESEKEFIQCVLAMGN